MKSDPQVVEVVETVEMRRQRSERVHFETDRHLVIGDVILPANGYQGRFSDAINRPDVSFIPLLDVELIPLGEGHPAKHDFLLLSKSHIRLAHPAPAGESR
jgi:Family of unknown function (DUF6812)